jgi:cytochrome c peroxidase
MAKLPLTLLVTLAACTDAAAAPTAMRVFPTPFSTEEAPASGDALVAPLPASLDLDRRKVALGRGLFDDPRLSGDGAVACTGCHSLALGAANGLPRSELRGRAPVAVNVPSLFNGAYNFRFGWSGRFADIGEQLDAAMHSPTVMAGTWPRAAAALGRDAAYVDAFGAIYPEGLTADSLREVMAFYSLSLTTPNSRFDRFLRGEVALGAAEARGYELFRDYGCVSCHQGINVGGNMFQRFGVMRDYFADRGAVTAADLGLFAATQREEDKFVFRVASLRNVALTAPYFHDGSAATLEQAVVTMARYQLGRDLADEEVGQVAAFLRTLTGELEGRPL